MIGPPCAPAAVVVVVVAGTGTGIRVRQRGDVEYLVVLGVDHAVVVDVARVQRRFPSTLPGNRRGLCSEGENEQTRDCGPFCGCIFHFLSLFDDRSRSFPKRYSNRQSIDLPHINGCRKRGRD